MPSTTVANFTFTYMSIIKPLSFFLRYIQSTIQIKPQNQKRVTKQNKLIFFARMIDIKFGWRSYSYSHPLFSITLLFLCCVNFFIVNFNILFQLKTTMIISKLITAHWFLEAARNAIYTRYLFLLIKINAYLFIYEIKILIQQSIFTRSFFSTNTCLREVFLVQILLYCS